VDKKRNELSNEVLELKQNNNRQKEEIKNLENTLQKDKQLSEHIIERQAQEIVSLKSKDLNTQILKKNTELQKLISTAKSKAGTDLPRTIDSLLDVHVATLKEIKENDNTFVQGQLTAYQSILTEKLTNEEIQAILAKQKDIKELKQQLANLGIREITQQIRAQILHNPPKTP